MQTTFVRICICLLIESLSISSRYPRIAGKYACSYFFQLYGSQKVRVCPQVISVPVNHDMATDYIMAELLLNYKKTTIFFVTVLNLQLHFQEVKI